MTTTRQAQETIFDIFKQLSIHFEQQQQQTNTVDTTTTIS